jgi:hypothetical protein
VWSLIPVFKSPGAALLLEETDRINWPTGLHISKDVPNLRSTKGVTIKFLQTDPGGFEGFIIRLTLRRGVIQRLGQEHNPDAGSMRSW